MNSRTLIIMFGLVMAGFAFFLLTRDKDVEIEARNPLAAIDFASLRLIEVTDDQGRHYSLAPWKSITWSLRSKDVAEGREVPADDKTRRRLVGALRDCEPRASFEVDEATVAAQKLSPARLSIRLVDASGEVEIEVGERNVDDQILYREKGSSTAFSVHYSIFRDFARSPNWYRDPRLTEAHFVDLQRVTIQENNTTLVFERSDVGWSYRRADGVVVKGDPAECDQFIGGLLAIEARPPESDDMTPEFRDAERILVTIESIGDRKETFEIVKVDDDRQRIWAKRADDPAPRMAGRDAWRNLRRPREGFESRRLLSVDISELKGIKLTQGTAAAIEVDADDTGLWRVQVPASQTKPRVDQERFNEFVDRLLNLRFDSVLTDQIPSEPEHILTLQFGGTVDRPPLVINFGPANLAGKKRRVTIRDRENHFALADASLGVLSTKWWDLAPRFVSSASELDIKSLTIEDRTQGDVKTFPLIRSIDSEGEEIWNCDQNEIPAEIVNPLISRLAHLSIDDYFGEPRGLGALAKKTSYVLRWTIDQGEGMEDIERIWTIRGLFDDQRWAAEIAHFPGVAFLIRGEDLLAVTVAVDTLRRF